MRIHREGYPVIAAAALFFLILNAIAVLTGSSTAMSILLPVSILLFMFVVSFFRSPVRRTPTHENSIIAPADGRIISIEPVQETEYFHDERLMVSIFLSVFNVHKNWIPLNGTVAYQCYHPGRYLVAFHPKSSLLNERSTVVIEDAHGRAILVRQIAGLLARRIKCYTQPHQVVEAGGELGFIRFGSRVDIFLPTDCTLHVRLRDHVRGGETILASFDRT